MIIPLLAAVLIQAQPAPPREWRGGDAGVRFAEGSRLSAVVPSGRWTGQVAIDVRCIVAPDGRLTSCAMVPDEDSRRVSARSARNAFRRARIEMTPDGPRPGDALTLEIVVTQNRGG